MSTVEIPAPPFRKSEDALIVAVLAAGHSYADAAEHAGVSRSTVARRMSDPEFRALVEAERESLVEQARTKLARAAGGAVETLIDLSESARGESVRLGAARAVVEIALSRRPGMNWIELSEFQRLTGQLIDVALLYVPVVERARFLDDLSEAAGGRAM